MCIPGEDVHSGNGDVPHRECTSSLEMGMCLTRNAYPHRKWGCASPGMHILTRNAHSLYRVQMKCYDHQNRFLVCLYEGELVARSFNLSLCFQARGDPVCKEILLHDQLIQTGYQEI